MYLSCKIKLKKKNKAPKKVIGNNLNFVSGDDCAGGIKVKKDKYLMHKIKIFIIIGNNLFNYYYLLTY